MLLLLVLLSVFHFTMQEACLYMPNTLLVGGTYEEFNASDIRTCCIECANDNCCIAYTYSKELKRCFLKSAITNSEDNNLFYSGVKANLAGTAARLKNIKIEGGKSPMQFYVQEDCKQYCTAFGMYSWTPARSGQVKGECYCLNRLVRLVYDHGSTSYISAPPKSS